MLRTGPFGMSWSSIEVTLPSGTTHDWSPVGVRVATIIYVTADPLGSTIGGLVDTMPDHLVIIRPVGGGALQVLHEDASATAAYRFLLIQSATVNLSNYLGLALVYDAASARWRQVGSGV
jgi:hypothetical protein